MSDQIFIRCASPWWVIMKRCSSWTGLGLSEDAIRWDDNSLSNIKYSPYNIPTSAPKCSPCWASLSKIFHVYFENPQDPNQFSPPIIISDRTTHFELTFTFTETLSDPIRSNTRQRLTEWANRFNEWTLRWSLTNYWKYNVDYQMREEHELEHENKVNLHFRIGSLVVWKINFFFKWKLWIISLSFCYL